MNPKHIAALVAGRMGAAPFAPASVSAARFSPSADSLTDLTAVIILCEEKR